MKGMEYRILPERFHLKKVRSKKNELPIGHHLAGFKHLHALLLMTIKCNRLMLAKQSHKPSPSHHHLYRWYKHTIPSHGCFLGWVETITQHSCRAMPAMRMASSGAGFRPWLRPIHFWVDGDGFANDLFCWGGQSV